MKPANVRNKLFIFLMITFGVIWAMPPRPGLKLPPTDYQEMLNLGINVIKDPIRDPDKKGIYNKPGDVVPLITGTKHFPVVLIKFPDYSNQYSVANFQAMLFSDTWSSGSAKKYYQEVSYGMFTLSGTVYGWYTSDSNKASYGRSNGFQKAAELAKEAAQKADAVINYALYDNDGDGFVDCFTCVHAGFGYEETGDDTDIHSHSWSFSSALIGIYTTNDPDPNHPGQYIKIDQYVIDPERSYYSNRNTMVTIGVFCHEWGHALGLPDLYDTDQNDNGNGLGFWCLMAAGSWGGNGYTPWYPVHLSAWAKMELGWLNPTAVRRIGYYTIPQVETISKAYWLIGRQRTFKEYFLVENRRKTRFDVNLPGQGLLIYHIDDSVIASRRWSNNINGGNGWKYGVALEQADGLDELYIGTDNGDGGDPFPGTTNNTRFDSSTTTPNSKTNYPTSSPLVTGILAKNIPASSPVVSCSLLSGVRGAFMSSVDAGGYYWIDSDTTGGPAYNWIDITQTGTALGTGDDARYWFRLPFSFNFYGTYYDTVWVSTNGWISFGSNPGTNAPTNTQIPSTTSPNRAVYVFWDDLNVSSSDGGNIYYQIFGSAPNRYAVITWHEVRNKNSPYTYNRMSFQVILYEDGRIVMQYKDCAVGDSLYNWGRNATIGIENANGTIGLQYLYNGTPAGNLVTNERAIQFAKAIKDVAVMAIEQPTGSFDSTGAIVPRVRVANNGLTQETFSANLKIGTSYSSVRTKTLNPGAQDTILFTSWTPLRGSYLVKCSLYLANDAVPANDTMSTSIVVGVSDVELVSINYPTGIIDSGPLIYPRVTVKNHSVSAKTFNITFKVSNNYTNTRSKTLASNAQDTVNFSLWTGSRGPYTTRCSLYLANDVYRRNDTLSGSFTLQVHDVGVVSIVQPTDSVDRGDLQPKATIRNYGSVPEAFYTFFKIYNSTGSLVYLDSVYINNLNPSTQTTRTFRSFIFQVGSYQMRCSTALANDANPSNNVKFKTIYVRYTPPWVRKRDVPVGPSSKPVSYGGALVAGDGKVYLLKGNNTREFFVYNPDTDSWTLLESIPFISDSSRKKVNKGAVLAYNNHANPDVIYATKGNNTLEFWMYDTENDTWIPKAPVPVSYPVKKVKGGAALVYLKRGNNQYVYLLKGNNTNEFYCYHCQADTWITNLRRPPLGPYLKAYKDGSCMTVGYNNYLYLLKGGATINEFYAYVPSGDSWITLETLPRYSRLLNKATKVKDGAAICYDGDSLLYVIKGGGKQDFWCYNAIRHTWKELDTIPKAPSNKAPKSGSALAFLDDKIYLIKGNRTYEFWRYIPGISDVPLAYPMVVPNLTIEQPSKLNHTGKVHAITDWSNRNLLLRLSLDQTSQVQVNLYNSAGQLVRKVLHTELGRGNYELAIAKAELSAGVYLVKCQINGTTYQYKWTLR